MNIQKRLRVNQRDAYHKVFKTLIKQPSHLIEHRDTLIAWGPPDQANHRLFRRLNNLITECMGKAEAKLELVAPDNGDTESQYLLYSYFYDHIEDFRRLGFDAPLSAKFRKKMTYLKLREG